LQSSPVYPCSMTVNHRVAGSSPAWGASFCRQWRI